MSWQPADGLVLLHYYWEKTDLRITALADPFLCALIVAIQVTYVLLIPQVLTANIGTLLDIYGVEKGLEHFRSTSSLNFEHYRYYLQKEVPLLNISILGLLMNCSFAECNFCVCVCVCNWVSELACACVSV
jgi:hypothetical protein